VNGPWPWPQYRCTKCESVMHFAADWEEHMKAHLRLEQLEKDLAKFGLGGVDLQSTR
jgi:hypothetical protein